jgi:hypothetical protein
MTSNVFSAVKAATVSMLGWPVILDGW